MDTTKNKDFAAISEEERNNFLATLARLPEEKKYADRLLYLYQNLASHIHECNYSQLLTKCHREAMK